MAVQLADPATVLRIYYTRREINSRDMRELFGNIGQPTISRLKQKALELMQERNIGRMAQYAVNTEVAFEAWGIDIAKIERQYKKLKALGLDDEYAGKAG